MVEGDIGSLEVARNDRRPPETLTSNPLELRPKPDRKQGFGSGVCRGEVESPATQGRLGGRPSLKREVGGGSRRSGMAGGSGNSSRFQLVPKLGKMGIEGASRQTETPNGEGMVRDWWWLVVGGWWRPDLGGTAAAPPDCNPSLKQSREKTGVIQPEIVAPARWWWLGMVVGRGWWPMVARDGG